MSSINLKKSLVQVTERSYLNRDFNSFRADLLRYATTYYPDKQQDYSEGSFGGLFNDLTAYVGDVMSFYLDHQFNELNLETAVEPVNIERQIRLAGVKIRGASPALCNVDFSIKVEAEVVSGVYRPKIDYLPIIKQGTKVQSNNGTLFELLDDLEFSKTNSAGALIANVSVSSTTSDGKPSVYKLTRTSLCTSGETVVEKVPIDNNFTPFRTITLSRNNVSEIIRVVDTSLNEYYEVNSLTNDVVYKKVKNTRSDASLVQDNLYIIPAPYRYVTRTSINTALTTLVFGSGIAETSDDDILPDPSEVALPLYGSRKTFSRAAIDQNSLLKTKSLGVTPVNTTLTITYRAGGGLNHNVAPRTIKSVGSLVTKFNQTVPAGKVAQIRASIELNNPDFASGGEDIPTLDELRSIAINYKNSQMRIVTRSDLIARVYSMPPNFGRVYRVGVRQNPTNPLSTLLYIISRDADGALTVSPDSLKVNLAKYLNEFRLTSDAIDILDAPVVNYRLTYNVVIDDSVDKTTTIAVINQKISSYLQIKNFQIDQPLMISDVLNLIINQDGVISLEKYIFENLRNSIQDRIYSEVAYNLTQNTTRGMIVPPPGGIFELKYPDFDIVGNAV